jgi:hypothetical protein
MASAMRATSLTGKAVITATKAKVRRFSGGSWAAPGGVGSWVAPERCGHAGDHPRCPRFDPMHMLQTSPCPRPSHSTHRLASVDPTTCLGRRAHHLIGCVKDVRNVCGGGDGSSPSTSLVGIVTAPRSATGLSTDPSILQVSHRTTCTVTPVLCRTTPTDSPFHPSHPPRRNRPLGLLMPRCG